MNLLGNLMGERKKKKQSSDAGLSREEYCPTCTQFNTSIGVCSKFKVNISSHPKQFIKKCSANYYEQIENE